VFHVAHNVVRLRKFRKLTQHQLASSVGTSQASIARLEGGQANITLRTLQRLVGALDGRLRLWIEPAEANLPQLPDWWEVEDHFVGIPPLQCKAILHHRGSGRHMVAVAWIEGESDSAGRAELASVAEGRAWLEEQVY
jgi:transcriptional regulator with XRE-family HTH domain